MEAIYSRVSSKTQDTRAQDGDLSRWKSIQSEPVIEYTDKFTGRKMSRPGMDKLLADVRAGVVTKVVVWRLDRLGRTARGLLNLFHELQEYNCGFLSLKDSIDLDTASGRLLLTVLAGVAEFETEVRSERQRAGIAAVKKNNNGKCPWGGRKVGTRITITAEKEAAIKDMYAAKKSVSVIAKVIGVSRKSVYQVVKSEKVPKTVDSGSGVG